MEGCSDYVTEIGNFNFEPLLNRKRTKTAEFKSTKRINTRMNLENVSKNNFSFTSVRGARAQNYIIARIS